jgi:hypothetical protein
MTSLLSLNSHYLSALPAHWVFPPIVALGVPCQTITEFCLVDRKGHWYVFPAARRGIFPGTELFWRVGKLGGWAAGSFSENGKVKRQWTTDGMTKQFF